jgi:hypothetical protein
MIMPDGKEVELKAYCEPLNPRRFPSRIMKMSHRRKKKAASAWLKNLLIAQIHAKCHLTDKGYQASDVEKVMIETLDSFEDKPKYKLEIL